MTGDPGRGVNLLPTAEQGLHDSGGAGMSMEAASIAQHCRSLRRTAIGFQFAYLAEEAAQNHSHFHYLEALLQAEVEELL